MIEVVIDGQNFPLPDEIGAKDELVRAALAPFVPWIVNAQIQRKEEAGNTVVTIIKRADTKGSAGSLTNALIAALEERNPAIDLWTKLQQEAKLDDPGAMIEWQPAIANAIQAGEREIETIHKSLAYLAECAPVPASRVTLGF